MVAILNIQNQNTVHTSLWNVISMAIFGARSPKFDYRAEQNNKKHREREYGF